LQLSDEYEVVLRPEAGWLSIDVAAIWRYRDLIVLLVRRDFVAKYTQTILGPAWCIAQPVLTTIVFTLVFGHAIGLSTDGLPPVLFYLCGQLAWNYFSANVAGTSTSLVANLGLLSKVYFPRLVIPIATVISNLLALALELATFFAFFAFFKVAGHSGGFHLSPRVVLLVPLVLQIAALSLGVGLLMAAMTAKYRDLTHAMSLLIQLWMFATPVIYPMSQLPARWRAIALVNPMAPIVEASRRLLLGAGDASPRALVASAITTAVLFSAGVLVFSRVERNFVDAA
jgi:lipopolysaccharide transport system permease protein